MKCETIIEDLQAFLDDELQVARRHEIETHLHGCNDCTRMIEDLGDVTTMLKSWDIPTPTLPTGQQLLERAKPQRSSLISRFRNLFELFLNYRGPAFATLAALIIVVFFISIQMRSSNVANFSKSDSVASKHSTAGNANSAKPESSEEVAQTPTSTKPADLSELSKQKADQPISNSDRDTEFNKNQTPAMESAREKDSKNSNLDDGVAGGVEGGVVGGAISSSPSPAVAPAAVPPPPPEPDQKSGQVTKSLPLEVQKTPSADAVEDERSLKRRNFYGDPTGGIAAKTNNSPARKAEAEPTKPEQPKPSTSPKESVKDSGANRAIPANGGRTDMLTSSTLSASPKIVAPGSRSGVNEEDKSSRLDISPTVTTETKTAAGKKRDESKVKVSSSGQKLTINSAKISIESKNIDETRKLINELTVAQNGTIENFAISSPSSGRVALVTIKLPANNFDTLLTAFTKLGKVTENSVERNDVSNQYKELAKNSNGELEERADSNDKKDKKASKPTGNLTRQREQGSRDFDQLRTRISVSTIVLQIKEQ